jgi:hypothetical protein
LIVVDEAAQVPDELYAVIRPMLAISAGRLVLMSTPFGKRGFFYEAWRSSEPWERYEVPASKVPRIAPEFVAEERRSTGEWWARQEWDVEFLDSSGAAFREADVEAAFDEEVETWEL